MLIMSHIWLLMIDPDIFLNIREDIYICMHAPPHFFVWGTVEHIHSRRPKISGYLISEDTIEVFHPASLCNANTSHKPSPLNTSQTVYQYGLSRIFKSDNVISFRMKASLPR